MKNTTKMNPKVTAAGDVRSQFASSGPLLKSPEKRFLARVVHRMSLPFLVAVVLYTGFTSSSHAQTDNKQQKLESLLKRYPDADANKDGKLSEVEARQYATKLRGKAKVPPAENALPPADLRDEKYGVHERHVLDFWFAKNKKVPAPLIVFIHGGGFVGGDKSMASPDAIREALDGGAAFMSINYRFREHAPIQDILRDAARAIQFVRANAARFHIDPQRIASFGGSAGAGTSLWLATHDDLADPKSADIVLRQSSRISAAGSLNGQATYDTREWDRVIFPFKPEWRKGKDEAPRFYHFTSEADLDTEHGKRIRADCNMLGLLTADDPPLYLSCSLPDGEPTNRGNLLHHPRHAQVIERRCKELKIPVTAVYAGDQTKTESAVGFLLRHVAMPVAEVNNPEGAKKWEKAIEEFEAADLVNPPPKGAVLLIGGSNARRWADVGTFFPEHKFINRGFGGASLAAILHYTDRIVLPYAPKTVFLNAGGNDLKSGRKTPADVCEMARAFSAKIHTTLPDTKVYAIGLPYVLDASNEPEKLATIQEMNRLLAELAKTEKNFGYIDLFSASVDDKGNPLTDFFVADGTHLSPKGYAALAKLLREKI
jgi:acetyl esterase/lipase/lysophospholipase L1-like esterase